MTNKIESWDTRLSIAQRALIIVGLIITGWYTLLRDDHSAHMEVSLSSMITEDCKVFATITINNPKGLTWTPISVTAQLFEPDFRQVITSSDNRLKRAEQVRTISGGLKIGEGGTIVFALDLSTIEFENGLILRAQVDRREGDTIVIRQVEQAIEAKQCS